MGHLNCSCVNCLEFLLVGDSNIPKFSSVRVLDLSKDFCLRMLNFDDFLVSSMLFRVSWETGSFSSSSAYYFRMWILVFFICSGDLVFLLYPSFSRSKDWSLFSTNCV